jgi:transcriptional regulator with XRE-family HTH domain
MKPNNLAAWRKSQNMTQTQLADKLSTTQPYISQIENGYVPGGEFMWRFYQAFGQDATTAAFSNGHDSQPA